MKKWYHTDDHHSPNLSKASLGNFFHHVLINGGKIGDVWVFDRRYNKSSVFVSVEMTEEQKRDIETDTKFRFRDPPKIDLN